MYKCREINVSRDFPFTKECLLFYIKYCLYKSFVDIFCIIYLYTIYKIRTTSAWQTKWSITHYLCLFFFLQITKYKFFTDTLVNYQFTWRTGLHCITTLNITTYTCDDSVFRCPIQYIFLFNVLALFFCHCVQG